jgi:hypothetical protein
MPYNWPIIRFRKLRVTIVIQIGTKVLRDWRLGVENP